MIIESSLYVYLKSQNPHDALFKKTQNYQKTHERTASMEMKVSMPDQVWPVSIGKLFCRRFPSNWTIKFWKTLSKLREN